mmetsp:Transcript_29184/g.93266  ORF Transcript_29184/g.93266 Transcript_29184/m.93266 type:complete len:246 (+) Transcript_29184:415-1152(+)
MCQHELEPPPAGAAQGGGARALAGARGRSGGSIRGAAGRGAQVRPLQPQELPAVRGVGDQRHCQPHDPMAPSPPPHHGPPHEERGVHHVALLPTPRGGRGAAAVLPGRSPGARGCVHQQLALPREAPRPPRGPRELRGGGDPIRAQEGHLLHTPRALPRAGRAGGAAAPLRLPGAARARGVARQLPGSRCGKCLPPSRHLFVSPFSPLPYTLGPPPSTLRSSRGVGGWKPKPYTLDLAQRRSWWR